MEFAPIQLPGYAQTGAGRKTTLAKKEAQFWRSLKQNTFIKDWSAVTHVHFNPATPHRFAVTSGTRVQDTARSAQIRDDGKLLVAGDDGGVVQVFDLASRAILRTIKDHNQPVHSTSFSSSTSAGNVPQILTASDDSTVRTFDLSTAAALSTFQGHQDYVRTAKFVPSNPNLYLSGCYDSTVKLWDARVSTENADVTTLNHGYPVESVLIHSSGSVAISAGGPLIKIWDLLSGSTRPLKALSNHQKTVTATCWADSSQSRLLSASLDGLVKVYDASDGLWRVGHTMRFGGNLLCMAVSPNENMLVVGAADGQISIKAKSAQDSTKLKPSKKAQALVKIAEQVAAGTLVKPDRPFEVTYRSKSRKRKTGLHEWDRLVKAFRFADALDCVLAKATDPKYSVALLNELKRLDALQQALRGRTDADLLPVLKFCNKQISDPRWGRDVAQFVGVLINLYDQALGRSQSVDNQFKQLKRNVQDEVYFHNELFAIKGALDMIFASQIDRGRPLIRL